MDRVGLASDADVDAVLTLLEETAAGLDEIAAAPSPRASVEELGAGAVWRRGPLPDRPVR